MTVRSKVSSKVSGLAKRADMLGAVVGYLGTFVAVTQSEGVGFFQGLIARHVNAIKVHNVNNLSNIPTRITTDTNWNGMILGGLGIGVAGLIGSYLPSVVPWQGSLTSLAKKAGFGAALGGLLANLVGAVSEGSGGSVIEGSSNPGSSSAKSSAPTGRTTRGIYGDFAVQTPYAGAWARPR